MARPDLVRMANQIAANFRHHPEAQAAAEVANHIRMFWPALMGRSFSTTSEPAASTPSWSRLRNCSARPPPPERMLPAAGWARPSPSAQDSRSIRSGWQ